MSIRWSQRNPALQKQHCQKGQQFMNDNGSQIRQSGICSFLLVLCVCAFLLWFRNKLQTHTPPQWSRNTLHCKCHQQRVVTSRNKMRCLFMSCQLTRSSLALRKRGCLSSGCHQLFILSFSTQTLHHLPVGLMVVVLWTITLHTTHLLYTSAHTCTQKHSSQTYTLNCYLHSTPLFLCPPPTPDPPVMKTRCFYSPRTEGSSSATQVRAPSPLLSTDAL